MGDIISKLRDMSWNVCPYSYEDIIKLWREKVGVKGIFEGHLFLDLTSEVSSIEGIEVSYNQTRELFESGTISNYSGDVRDLFSVLNNRNLAEFYNKCLESRTPITPEFIKMSHKKLMFASIDNHRYNDNGERPGEYKKKDYCIGKYDMGVLPEDVGEAVSELCGILAGVREDNVLKMATVFHCVFEGIHPFADGNGRTGRWLLNYFLVLNNHPPVVIRNANKMKYYSCLEAYDIEEDFDKMYDFLKNTVIDSYSSYSYLLKG